MQKALRELLDNPLMIGRHRKIVADWYNKWVIEIQAVQVISKEELEAAKDSEMLIKAATSSLRKKFYHDFENKLSVVQKRVPVTPSRNYNPAIPVKDDVPCNLELRISAHIFNE